MQFVEDVVIRGHAQLVGLQPQDMSAVMDAATRHRLDFDDAYQYVTAEKLGLQLVTFDSDFDRTPKRGVSPGQIASALDEPGTTPGSN
jgi:predicted nucleic acid-binding protein